MSAELLLSRLERVRPTGRGRWMASCPTRRDRSPSLSIRELDDGRVLLHDFGGDSVEDVLAAVGLDMADLFPERIEARRAGGRERRPFSAQDVLRAVAFEGLTVLLIAGSIKREGELSEESRRRLGLAVERLMAADELINAR